MLILSKPCRRCKIDKPLTEYYKRSGVDNPIAPGHYQSECIDCLKERSKTTPKFSRNIPLTVGEIHCIDYLNRHAIYAAPGKSVYAADVDVVAWGCVKIEVKHAILRLKNGREQYTFTATPQQMKRGFLAQVVVLICEDAGELTYHWFDAKDPVFYMKGRTKSGFTFVPGRFEPLKHGNNRVVMTQGMMDNALDRLSLIEENRLRIAESLKRTA
jgi:hypothetical protein